MATSCYITDYTTNDKTALFFKDVDFATVDNHWDKEDALLLDLSDTIELFKGCTTWSSLSPLHWQILIATNLREVTRLSIAEQQDMANATVFSLHCMIMGLITCLEVRCGYVNIDTIKIVRVADLDCHYDINMNMATLRAPDEEEKPKPAFSVIVDNTDKK
jgi:hypothetical protein